MNSFVWIDVHQDERHATIQDGEGETVKRGYFQNSPSGFEQFSMILTKLRLLLRLVMLSSWFMIGWMRMGV